MSGGDGRGRRTRKRAFKEIQCPFRSSGASCLECAARRSAAVACIVVAGSAALALSACSSLGSGSGGSGSASSGSGGTVKVALILKEFTNPYWISVEKSAEAAAAKQGIQLEVTAGNSDDDTTSQISQIDDAISAGDKGIIIALNGAAVNGAQPGQTARAPGGGGRHAAHSG